MSLTLSPSPAPPVRIHRTLLVLGAAAVGKSSLCVRFASDRFDDSYEPTYENTYTKVCHYKNHEIECRIKDTQGLASEDRLRAEYGLGIHGYILVYSVNSLTSFLTIKAIHDKLCECVGTNEIPRILVGHKSDLGRDANSSMGGLNLGHRFHSHSFTAGTGLATALKSDDQSINQSINHIIAQSNNRISSSLNSNSVSSSTTRQVSFSEGFALARELGIPFIECSSKSNVNVDAVFMSLFDEIDRISEPGSSTFRCPWLCCSCFRDCCGIADSFVDRLQSSQSNESNKLEKTVSTLVSMTLLLGLFGIAGSIYLGVTAASDSYEVFAFCVFGFSFACCLISLIGMFGLRQSLVEFMRVYSIALAVLFLSQLAAYFTLLSQSAAFDQVLIQATCVCAGVCLVEGISSGVMWWYAHLLRASLASSSFTSAQHSTLGTLDGGPDEEAGDEYYSMSGRKPYSMYQAMDE